MHLYFCICLFQKYGQLDNEDTLQSLDYVISSIVVYGQLCRADKHDRANASAGANRTKIFNKCLCKQA